MDDHMNEQSIIAGRAYLMNEALQHLRTDPAISIHATTKVCDVRKRKRKEVTTILYEKLVELGADKLVAMFDALVDEANHNDEGGASHYFKGGFQALKEAAALLFSKDPDDFRYECMVMIEERQTTAQASLHATSRAIEDEG